MMSGPRVRRRPDGRQVRAGHHLPGRRRRRHRRGAPHRDRGDRHPPDGGDVAKCLALGADAIAIGHSALMALNCNKEIPGVTDYEGTIGVPAGQCYHCHTGRCPVGITTQDPELRKRLVVDDAAHRVYNFLHTLTLECQMLARACGKTNVHNLEPEDLCALTVEASAMARVPLAGTEYIPGVSEDRALDEIKRLLERHIENPIDSHYLA